MIDLQTLPAPEAERLAYAEGYTGTAALFARIADLEHLLYLVLPYLEDIEGDDGYDEGVITAMIDRVRAALGEQ